jgi:predicted transcriptional regulator of viral defense system
MGKAMSDQSLSRTLSERESLLLSSLSAAGCTVFSIQDARAVLGDRETDIRKLLHRLNRKRWIKRLERGRYLIVPLAAGPDAEWAEHEYLIAASLVEPYYLAYATALHYHGYTERSPDPVTVATTRRKNPVTIEGLTYRFVTLTAHKFFGYQTISLLGEDVQMAEPEKAIADGFDHPQLAGGVLEPAKGLWFGSEELDWEKLATYTLRLQNQVTARRLGFWMELLGLGSDDTVSRLENGGGHSYARLEPSGPRNGPRNARWRIIVNVPQRQLLEWREH